MRAGMVLAKELGVNNNAEEKMIIDKAKKIRQVLGAIFGLILLAWGTAFMAGCDDCCDDGYIIVEDDTPPAVPRGLYSVTGDGEVYLYWYANQEEDFNFYVVYRSTFELAGPYTEIATTTSPEYVDRQVTNGRTYFYAVTAVDDSYNESDLSYEDVFDTPRPEGYGVRVYNYNHNPEVSGFCFWPPQVVDGDDLDADIWFDYIPEHGVFYINVANDMTDLQDYGYTESIDEVGWSPDEGWSELGYAEVIVGHAYVIWTDDNHYAKIRVTEVIPGVEGSLRFDWAYQIAEGNQELKLEPKVVPVRPEGYGNKLWADGN